MNLNSGLSRLLWRLCLNPETATSAVILRVVLGVPGEPPAPTWSIECWVSLGQQYCNKSQKQENDVSPDCHGSSEG